ncbi:hypothetical protein, partial [Laribacter hongkongensis]|uniref:hypothetical protein n=1 Tax=Laribacter hongkongensis TaxID=168471 RepID=UPI001EFEC743
ERLPPTKVCSAPETNSNTKRREWQHLSAKSKMIRSRMAPDPYQQPFMNTRFPFLILVEGLIQLHSISSGSQSGTTRWV